MDETGGVHVNPLGDAAAGGRLDPHGRVLDGSEDGVLVVVGVEVRSEL